MTGVRLVSIEIEGFRGFAERRLIDLNADAIVVRGDNGTGKTSLIDALLWVTSGELAHLVDRVRGLRKTEDVVTNRFKPGKATVSLRLRSGEDYITVTRIGTQKANQLSVWLNGVERSGGLAALADVLSLPGPEEVGRAVSSWGILRQDHIRAALDTAGGELHQRLSGIVGLEHVTAFAEACDRATRDLNRERAALRRSQSEMEQRLKTAEIRHAAAAASGGSEVRVRETLRDGFLAISKSISPQLRLRSSELSLDATAELGRSATAILQELERVFEREEMLRASTAGADAALAAAQEAVASARQKTEDTSHQAPANARLAEAALPLLGDQCPVCGQSIDVTSVRTHLEETLASARSMVEAARIAQQRLVEAESQLAAVSVAAVRRQRLENDLNEARVRLRTAVAASAGAILFDEGASTSNLVETLQSTIEQLRALYRQAQEASGSHLERLGAEAAAIEAEVQRGGEELGRLEQRAEDARMLQHAAHEASRRIVERALTALQPSFADVFDRLKPNQAFTELGVRQDVMYNTNQVVPVVRDVGRGIDANPALVFSEGQLNVVALSYFLGMALNARYEALPFLVLDDPLQSLDVIAILNFSDLCRRIRDERQLIITTHDRRFADVLGRKLAPRNEGKRLLVHDFEGWTREGPVIHTRRPELVAVVPVVPRAA